MGGVRPPLLRCGRWRAVAAVSVTVTPVLKSDVLGVPNDAKEAILFAFLAA